MSDGRVAWGAWVVRGAALALWLGAGTAALAMPASPRPHSWVADGAGMLDAAAERRIDQLVEDARAVRPVELAVVTVGDIGGADPRKYATRLFNDWGIGDPARHDGVLVFIAREQRAAEIILGQGIDGDAQVATSRRIMDGVLVAHLRRGDAAGGLTRAVQALLREIHGITPVAPAAAADAAPALLLERERAPAPVARRPVAPVERGWADRLQDHLPVAVGGGGLLALLGAFGLRTWWRVRGRRCPRCAAPMQRLDEQADDARLQPAQQLEERLGSVDYDVWLCTACPHSDVRGYGAWFSSWRSCPACKARTLKRQSTTLRAATTSMGGLVRIDEDCAHCGHAHSHERSTPRLSSSSSGSRSRSGFSGGRSRGRGASGRW